MPQDGLYYPWGQAWTSFSYEQRFASLGYHENETDLYWTQFRRYSSRLGRTRVPSAVQTATWANRSDVNNRKVWNELEVRRVQRGDRIAKM